MNAHDSGLRTQDSALSQDSGLSNQDSAPSQDSGLRTQHSALSNEDSAHQVWTIGHSTRSIEDFKSILKAHKIEALVDVRTFPGSRRYPHFNRENLSQSLLTDGIEYVHMPRLGGRRKALADSKNTNWQNAGFRGYADHMESEEFRKGISELKELARSKRTTFMCAESLWWRCHRSLIADYLKVEGWQVVHILDAKKVEEHPYTSAARIVDGRLSYEGLI